MNPKPNVSAHNLPESPGNREMNGEGHGECSKLRFTLLAAENLPRMDMTGSADPYVMIQLDSEKQRSNIKKRTVHPEWDEVFVFEVGGKLNHPLMLTVMDWDAWNKVYCVACFLRIPSLEVILTDVSLVSSSQLTNLEQDEMIGQICLQPADLWELAQTNKAHRWPLSSHSGKAVHGKDGDIATLTFYVSTIPAQTLAHTKSSAHGEEPTHDEPHGEEPAHDQPHVATMPLLSSQDPLYILMSPELVKTPVRTCSNVYDKLIELDANNSALSEDKSGPKLSSWAQCAIASSTTIGHNTIFRADDAAHREISAAPQSALTQSDFVMQQASQENVYESLQRDLILKGKEMEHNESEQHPIEQESRSRDDSTRPSDDDSTRPSAA